MKTIFLDIGGVILTNGWDHKGRKELVEKFHLDWDEFSKLHEAYYPAHEEGQITLSEYLQKTVFYKKRDFSEEDFINAMKALSRPFDHMLELFKDVKHKVNTIFLSNEGRDLAEWRIKHFNLAAISDFFIVSCFVGLRKPDPKIYRLALDLSQVKKEDLLYIDDRKNLIETASALGIPSLQHTDYETTKNKLYEWIT